MRLNEEEKFSDDETRQHIGALPTGLGATQTLHFVVLLAFRSARLAGRSTCTAGISAQSRLARAECAAQPAGDAAVHAQPKAPLSLTSYSAAFVGADLTFLGTDNAGVSAFDEFMKARNGHLWLLLAPEPMC